MCNDEKPTVVGQGHSNTPWVEADMVQPLRGQFGDIYPIIKLCVPFDPLAIPLYDFFPIEIITQEYKATHKRTR